MSAIVIIGGVAGLVSALLFSTAQAGSQLAFILSCLAPLPVFIAALGWKHSAGLVAAATGAIAVALGFRWLSGLAFAIGAGLPAWWIAYLTLLGRRDKGGEMTWYPLGRVLLWSAGIAAAVTVAAFMTIAASHGGWEIALRRLFATALGSDTGPMRGVSLPSGVTQDELIDAVIALVPLVTSAMSLILFVVNLWLAATAVAISGRLPRPWPSIADTAMPPLALAALAAAIALVWIASGTLDLLAKSLCGALLAAFMLQGLAAIHARSRGKRGRGAILGGVYALLVVLPYVTPLAILAAGIIDACLRRRDLTSAPPSLTST